jgi:hypothetical protein
MAVSWSTMKRFGLSSTSDSVKSQKLRDNLSALDAQLETAQNDALKQLGVTPKDIGLPEGSQTQK